jgi:hypothetical protein
MEKKVNQTGQSLKYWQQLNSKILVAVSCFSTKFCLTVTYDDVDDVYLNK